MSPTKSHNQAANAINEKTWSSSAESIDHCFADAQHLKMRHKLEYSERVKETAESQTDGVYFLNAHKKLEVLKYIRVVHVDVLVILQYNLNIFGNTNHKHCTQVNELQEVENSADAQL